MWQLASSRAGMCFFGALILLGIFGDEQLTNGPVLEMVIRMVSSSFVVAAFVFCYTWHGCVKQERDLAIINRQGRSSANGTPVAKVVKETEEPVQDETTS